MLPSFHNPKALLGKAILFSLLSPTSSAFNPLPPVPGTLNQQQQVPLDLNPPFDIREATISSIHNALFTGLTTCHALISSYLARIEAFNPSLHAILSSNPHALDLASAIDFQLTSGDNSSSSFFSQKPLLCIPILLKDNFNTQDMPTTAGSLALSQNTPSQDAPTVSALKTAGAIILGKTNMHEFALEGISVSSLGGQTINPYDSSRTPGGSSGGTGAAIAANLAVLGTGTDTVNSLRSPASANSLWSWRPTRGMVTREGVVPVGWTQDAVGGMARGVHDLGVLMSVLSMAAGTGSEGDGDNTTVLVPPEVKGRDYSQALYGGLGKLKGLRLGVLDGFFNHTAGEETTPVNEVMEKVLRRLEVAGVQLVNITEPVYDAVAMAAKLDVQTFEFREGLDTYLEKTTYTDDGKGNGTSGPRSFSDIYTLGKKQFLVLPSQYGYIRNAFNQSASSPEYFIRQYGIQQLITALAKTFSTNNLDAIIYPEQKNLVVKIGSPSQSGRNGILAALTGSPVITVPVGFSEATETAPLGVPIGMEILGRPWTEDLLLGIAKHVGEALGPVRRMPVGGGLDKVVEVRGGGYEKVPVVKTDNGNIPGVYPLGVY